VPALPGARRPVWGAGVHASQRNQHLVTNYPTLGPPEPLAGLIAASLRASHGLSLCNQRRRQQIPTAGIGAEMQAKCSLG
jgi:hypothetical protein